MAPSPNNSTRAHLSVCSLTCLYRGRAICIIKENIMESKCMFRVGFVLGVFSHLCLFFAFSLLLRFALKSFLEEADGVLFK